MGRRHPLMKAAPLICTLLCAGCLRPGLAPTQAAPSLTPGSSFTVAFPEMPPTLFAMWNKRTDPAHMTVFLPRNYDPQRKHPLLIFLNGWDGGNAGDPTIARALSEEQDFVCVALPLFKERLDPSVSPETRAILVQDADCRFGWPYYRTMLGKLDELVPNLDPAHRILGGSSNGAQAVAGLVNESDGETARWFSAYFLVDGGGGLRRFDLLKDRPLLMVCGVWRPKPEAALAAGVKLTFTICRKPSTPSPRPSTQRSESGCGDRGCSSRLQAVSLGRITWGTA